MQSYLENGIPKSKEEKGLIFTNTWGGKRIGAGRPADLDPSGQKKSKHSLYCTAYELAMAREFLIFVRENKYKATVSDCTDALHQKLSDYNQTHART